MNILMLGVGADQLIAIKKALELELKVIGFDGNENAIGKDYVDYFEHVNIKNPDEVEKLAIKWNKKIGIDGVIAPAVDVGPSVGRVVDKLGLLGIGEKTATELTDKIRRRVILDDLSIPQPKWAYRDEKKSGLWKTYPCVVKPRDKAGAEGVRIANNVGEIGLNYDYVEEYLEGWELSVEVLVFGNTFFVDKIADRNYDKKHKWAPFLIEDGCSLPAKISQNMQRKVQMLIMKLVKNLNLSHCVIKLDLLVKDNIVYVIEIAPRLGGGKLSSIMIEKHCGVDWWNLAIKLAMGLHTTDSEITPSVITTPVAQRYVFPEKVTSHRDRITDFICEGETLEEAISNARQCVNNYLLGKS